VVFQTSIGNITDVLVAGRWKKRSGQLVDDNGQALNLAPLLDRLGASGRKIVQALAL
jgi:hypothetical protein